MHMSIALSQLLQTKQNRNGFIQMPLLSHIFNNVYIGMSPVYWPTPPSMFHTIFNLFIKEEYPIEAGQIRYNLNIRDSFISDRIPAQELIQHTRLCGKTSKEDPRLILIHCQMGINRSALLCAMVLMMEYDKTAEEAMQLIRNKRSEWCLMN